MAGFDPKVNDLCNQAYDAIDDGKPQEAIKFLEQAMAIDPKNAQVLRIWGCALEAQGDHINAFRFYEQAVEISPHDNANQYSLAKGYAWRDDKEQMLEHLRTAIEIGGRHNCDLRGEALKEPLFQKFLEDPDFLALVYPFPVELKEFLLAYWDLKEDKALDLGAKLLEKQSVRDKIAVLTIMIQMADSVVTDTDDDDDMEEYEHKYHQYYVDVLKYLKDRKMAVKASGERSDFWKRFKLDFDPEIDDEDGPKED